MTMQRLALMAYLTALRTHSSPESLRARCAIIERNWNSRDWIASVHPTRAPDNSVYRVFARSPAGKASGARMCADERGHGVEGDGIVRISSCPCALRGKQIVWLTRVRTLLYATQVLS